MGKEPVLCCDDFPKEMLIERKKRVEDGISAFRREQAELESHPNTVVLIDELFADIKAFYEKVHDGFVFIDFTTKRQILDLQDGRGTLALENDEKVIYLIVYCTQTSYGCQLPEYCLH